MSAVTLGAILALRETILTSHIFSFFLFLSSKNRRDRFRSRVTLVLRSLILVAGSRISRIWLHCSFFFSATSTTARSFDVMDGTQVALQREGAKRKKRKKNQGSDAFVSRNAKMRLLNNEIMD